MMIIADCLFCCCCYYYYCYYFFISVSIEKQQKKKKDLKIKTDEVAIEEAEEDKVANEYETFNMRKSIKSDLFTNQRSSISLLIYYHKICNYFNNK